jgi:hypothetical protein
MKLALHIERLVLDGLPVGAHEGPIVQAAVEAELARLFVQPDARPWLHLPSALSRLTAPTICVNTDSAPAHAGRQIAQAIHSSLEVFRDGRDARNSDLSREPGAQRTRENKSERLMGAIR